jgi:hypothetical protein
MNAANFLMCRNTQPQWAWEYVDEEKSMFKSTTPPTTTVNNINSSSNNNESGWKRQFHTLLYGLRAMLYSRFMGIGWWAGKKGSFGVLVLGDGDIYLRY